MADAASPVADSLQQAVEDAQLLVAYAANNGLLADTQFQALLDARRQLTANTLSVESEEKFWRAFNSIAALVKPATPEGIRASLGTARPSAEKSIRRYRWWAWGTLLVLAVIQIYYIVGFSLVREIQSVVDHSAAHGTAHSANEVLEVQQSVIERIAVFLSPAASLANGESPPATRASDIVRLRNSYDVLKQWNRIWNPLLEAFWMASRAMHFSARDLYLFPAQTSIPDYYSPDEMMCLVPHPGGEACTLSTSPREAPILGIPLANEAVSAVREITTAGFALTILQVFVLPFLYGFLGTCVYILRSLANDIRRNSFSSDMGYRLRMSLGALAGVAAAWVLTPEDSARMATLSPFSIAFIAGYGVEILFSAMDRLINSLSSEAQPASVSK